MRERTGRRRTDQWRILSKLKISKVDLSIVLILLGNCVALAYPVEKKLGKCFSRRNVLLNIFELNTWGSSSTRRSLPEFTREAWRFFKFLHGQVTKQHLERLTAGRLIQVCFVAFLLSLLYCIYFTLHFSMDINEFKYNRVSFSVDVVIFEKNVTSYHL